MQHQKVRIAILRCGAMLLTMMMLSCADPESIPVIVSVPSLSISKVPFVIAMDQGLYEKNGLNVELWLASPDSEQRTVVHGDLWTRIWRGLGINTPQQPDIFVDGATPMMVNVTQRARAPHQIVLAATDCVVRAHIIARRGIDSIEQLKGKRLGVSGLQSTAGFQAVLFAKQMGWDPVRDISIMAGAEEIDGLLDGTVDAIVGYEREYAAAKREGLPILLDMQKWNEFIAGNSVKVDPKWFEDGTHREAARRFLKATAEAIALFHERPELVMQVLDQWYGIKDREYAENLYARGAWIPRKPYPCYEGFKKTAELYDSNEMRRYRVEDFYDDSLIRELDESGFIDTLYERPPQSGRKLSQHQGELDSR